MLIWVASLVLGVAVFAAATAVGIQYGLSASAALSLGAIAAAVAIWMVLSGVGAE